MFTSDIALQGRFHWPRHDITKLLKFAQDHLAFTQGKSLIAPGTLLCNDLDQSLEEKALRSILVDKAEWFSQFQSAVAGEGVQVTVFGPERCIPPSIARMLGSNTSHFDAKSNSNSTGEGVAVVGMAIHAPGSSDLLGFWDTVAAGKSQHRELPKERFATMKTPWRTPEPGRKWYGNFIDDYDCFDHKFFRKSPRESASTDPQHRIALQVAYQALEQAGYFSKENDSHVGCYMGFGNSDYEEHVACHPANAFSATGVLKAFLPGRISHFFGWTGPSMSFDTACSSSSVAIHHACRAILTGDCSAALAGGSNLVLSPNMYHNLAGASFLSPTGQCKSFDISADGYCRGEAAGVVYLKKYSKAVADGDQILGVIAGSCVYQNQNCTPITVPNEPSLRSLFIDVLERAKLKPHDISVVEAHGTGTQVGDPAEVSGIRSVFGGLQKSSQPLSLISSKGLVGHSETASGVVSLIKLLLMMNQHTIPPQASFTKLNPALNIHTSDNIAVPTTSKKWNHKFKAALINNYGASGSNASMVVTQAPGRPRNSTEIMLKEKVPFWFSGFDDASLKRYITQFRKFVRDRSYSVSELSQQLAIQSNRTLQRAFILNASSIAELDQKLRAFESGEISSISVPDAISRPIILVFGGQVSDFVGLNKEVFPLLQSHIQAVDKLAGERGFPPILPTAIFQTKPIEDVVQLQLCLFALQFAAAKTWLDCGAVNKVVSVIGHSFGELSALCISGVLSLEDAVTIIGGRARVIRDKWTSDKGSMLAVECSQADAESLGLSVACCNTPKSFTLAGSSADIDAAFTTANLKGIKAKKLNVTHAFHSAFADELKPLLDELSETVKMNPPSIPIERSTEISSSSFEKHFLANHLRNPVYFSHAVKRLNAKYPHAIWIECGSNSTAPSMASHCVQSSNAHFQAINITSDNTLCNATTQLWRQGLNVKFWNHRHVGGTAVILPAYQFDKSRHLMELTLPAPEVRIAEQVKSDIIKGPTTLTSASGVKDGKSCFIVNTSLTRYKQNVFPHVMTNTLPVCPGLYQLEVVLDAFMSIQETFNNEKYVPEFRDIQYFNPVILADDIHLSVEIDCQTPSGYWSWRITSTNTSGRQLHHTSGKLLIVQSSTQDAEIRRMSRYGGKRRATELLNSADDTLDILQGRNIYRAFSPVIDYKDHYRHLSKIVGKNYESAGRVDKVGDRQHLVDTVLSDNFCQVAGIFVNLMTSQRDFNERGIFICNGIERWVRSPLQYTDKTWTVYSVHHLNDDGNYVSDVFAYGEQGLYEAVLGISYLNTSIAGVQKLLNQLISSCTTVEEARPAVPPMGLNGDAAICEWASSQTLNTIQAQPTLTNGIRNGFTNGNTHGEEHQSAGAASKSRSKTSKVDVVGKCQDILCNLCGIERNEIESDSDLVELGIDSLMSMELTREVKGVFNIDLETDHLMAMTDFQSFVDCIRVFLGNLNQEEATANGHVDSSKNGLSNGYSNGHKSSNESYGNSNEINRLDHAETELSAQLIRSTFADIKARTDDFIFKGHLGSYYDQVMPRSTEICIVYSINALEELGCPIKSAQPGQVLQRVQHLPKHKQQMDLMYDMIATYGKIIEIHPDGTITRTSVPLPPQPVDRLVDDLVRDEPIHEAEHKLTRIIGPSFANCLRGKQEGIQIIFGTAEGKRVVSDVYAKSPINRIWITQAAAFLEELLAKLPRDGQPIKILEMGAGTCGTTSQIIPLLESLNVPYKYTMTDLSSSLVAAARRRFKGNQNMEFATFDIEKDPEAKFIGSQHIILATNCVHATRNLRVSCSNIEKVLRPDGFLLLLEMTEQVPWVDFIFGLVEGWWLFEDDRKHALNPVEHWKKVLGEVGFDFCDWTAGDRPEANLQRLIIAQKYANPPRDAVPLVSSSPPFPANHVLIDTGRRQKIASLVRKYSHSFVPLHRHHPLPAHDSKKKTVLVTGATGSLGSHIVAEAVTRGYQVICINRPSVVDVSKRQAAAFERGNLHPERSSITIVETDTSKPLLGFTLDEYIILTEKVTHIVHNAWPMSLTRKLDAYETQFRVMRNLIDLANKSSAMLQFISSIGVVGKNSSLTFEEPAKVESVLAVGYAEAKLVCERMLHETLGKPSMSVRFGQIAGSTVNGYWNTVEHLASMVKSSQAVGAWPDLQGTLAWLPVGEAASVLLDLLDATSNLHEIYHVEGPRQPWSDLNSVICADLGFSSPVPYTSWLQKVEVQAGDFSENPAAQLLWFFETEFERMDCGELILDTGKSLQHSKTLRDACVINDKLMRTYMSYWRRVKFLM